MKPIEKININLFPESTSEENYNIERNKYIAEYEEYYPGLFTGGYRHNPKVGEAKWNAMYPLGYRDWRIVQKQLTALGEQKLIDKINELIEKFNSIHDTK